MKKLMLSVVALALAATMLTGCRVGGEIDPDGAASVVAPR